MRCVPWRAPVGGLGLVLVPGRRGPGVAAVVEALVVPTGVGLDPVMGPAQGCEVAGVGLAGWSAVVDRDVGADVVQVAGPGVTSAAGEDAARITQEDLLAHRRRRVMLVHGPSGVEVEDRAQHDLPAGPGEPGEPVGEQPGGRGTEAFDGDRTRATRSQSAVHVFGREVHEQVRHAAAATRAGGAVAPRHQVQRVLGVGEDPHRAGPADVEGVAVTELTQVRGHPSHALVEEVGVGGVQGHPHLGGRRRRAGAQPHPPLGQGLVLVGDRPVGVEVEPRFLDQSSGVDGPDLVRGGGDQPVGEPGGVQGQVAGLPGDQPGPPGRDGQVLDQRPESGQAVGQLEGITQELLGRIDGDLQGGTEVGGRELRHPRSTHTQRAGRRSHRAGRPHPSAPESHRPGRGATAPTSTPGRALRQRPRPRSDGPRGRARSPAPGRTRER